MLPIVRPFHPVLEEFDSYFSGCLKTGQVTNNGQYVREFEKELSKILGVPTLCFSSGMAALVAMLRAMDVDGQEVICPSFTFPATPNAIVLAGANPVFADINPQTLCLDVMDVEERATNKTAAVLGVDPYGICWEPPKWGDEVDILIDSAPSFGSTVHNKLGAKRGRAQIYSFHATKPFSTMEGGCLCSTDFEVMDRAERIRNFGQEQDGSVTEFGFNGKMMEICALIGLKQLEAWDYRVASRIDSAARLRRALDGIEGLRVQRAPLGQQPIWTYQPVFIEPEFGKLRDIVVLGLKAKGIGVRVYYPACHQMEIYNSTASLPVTERLSSQVISLPVYDEMTDREIEMIAKAFREIRG